MPIYEYRCTQCGHKLESLQKFSDAPLTTCPACGKEALSKLVSAAGFQLKGSGWYQTDFRGSGKPAEKGNGGNGKAAGDAGEGGKEKGASEKGGRERGDGERGDGGKEGSGATTATSGAAPASAPASSSTGAAPGTPTS